MPNAEESEAPIVRASRVHLRLERALGRMGIVAKRGFAGVDAMGEPVIDVGVIGASDGERLVDALCEAEADGPQEQQRDQIGALSQAPSDADGQP
ncbi:hypothetical protein KDK95_05880 [Actinospica sp. MGRD01-02]|uniref:Uncharacterized protein n=1 Tax=Actinospica acidithermotolerans TaxID=2828514 RepID=A0A941E436_9ACTN|nr:hypothetical protein [Actinospica acidithermotolerans]MBR7825830.1 hypothetical protein [Actinospica acidithermotolerans]